MVDIVISNELGDKCPGMALGVIQCNVKNTSFNEDLWEEIKKTSIEIRNCIILEEIKNQPNIAATRTVYKACGKDPNRYRPSAEAMHRRIVKGNELYQISTLVDIINLVSLKTGYSIGGFDADIITGKVTAGIGKENEPFTGIGRGKLNIAGLPILRDEKGGIGTPTSDEERTSIQLNTSNLLLNINGYTGPDPLKNVMKWLKDLLTKYSSADNIQEKIVLY
jgi:DNA/RNA-binding domain of Phe-tRNA-synthetase-like protein